MHGLNLSFHSWVKEQHEQAPGLSWAEGLREYLEFEAKLRSTGD